MPDLPDSQLLEQSAFQSVLAACLDAVQRGQKIDLEALEAYFPKYATRITQFLEDNQQLEAAAAGINDNDSEIAAAGEPETALLHPGAESSQPTTTRARSLGGYVLMEEIARGGMGAVYRASQPGLRREVAIKVILSGEFASEDQIRRFQAEAQSAAAIQHPSIVSIHDFGCDNGLHYFTMDLMTGGSLSQRLATEGCDQIRAARIIVQVARAVEYLHQRGVIHRDLKPSNILFNDDGAPCVTDFGLAKILEDDTGCTRTGDVLGTASYMSPEQASGMIRVVSQRSDIYSLGAILYEMLTGSPPFVGDSFVDTILRVIEGEPTPPRLMKCKVDRELELICLRCLEKRPEDRYASAGELADDLDRFLQGDPIESYNGDYFQIMRRACRRYPALAAHCLILLAVALIVLVRKMAADAANEYFYAVEGLIAVWIAASFVLQQLQAHDRWSFRGLLAWTLIDPLLITILIYLSEPPRETLLAAFPAFIAASGLWVREQLVASATLASMACYGVLLTQHRDLLSPVHHPMIFLSLLAIVGFVVSYQVRRLRMLNQFL